jgi:dihydrodipicolinate synthase/N-acetylneuraminate lyase
MPLPFRRNEAKDWARATWKGCCNNVIPTYKRDLSGLNPAGIAHDIKLSAQWGYWGSLLVSEFGTTLAEMKEFMRVAVAARPGNMRLVLQGSFNSLAETADAARVAEDLGIEALFVGYPPTFRPTSTAEIYDYTKQLAECTGLALILFAVPSWDFARLHSSQFPIDLLSKLCSIDTVVAVAYEAGRPGITGFVETHQRLGKQVLVSDPMESNCPGWVDLLGMQWMGISGYEYFGPLIPRLFDLLHADKQSEAMDLYWQSTPMRQARENLNTSVGMSAKFVHRWAWKYMGWLQGMSGGPARMPTMRLDQLMMRTLRDSVTRAGLQPTELPDAAFFEGRH